MSRLSMVLAMVYFMVVSPSCASAHQSAVDRQPQSAPQRINRVRIPTYLAQSMTRRVILPHDLGASGDVVLGVLVDKNGRVLNVQRISGDPLLFRAAKPALMKLIFTPFFLNGEAVQFLTELTIMFDGKGDFAKLKVEPDPLFSRNPTPR